MTKNPASDGGTRVLDHDSQHGVAVLCARCGAVVDLCEPLALAGWQPVHRCAGHRIEALTEKAGSLPWAWRTGDEKRAD